MAAALRIRQLAGAEGRIIWPLVEHRAAYHPLLEPRVLIDCARKILTVLNAIMQDNTPWIAPESKLEHSC